ncbi:MAG: hypothetical protein ABTQ73_12745 [Caldilineales bacterium]
MTRKATPTDLLDELLTGAADGQAPAAASAPVTPIAPVATRKARAQRASKPVTADPLPPAPATGWRYLLVSFAEYHGWRPRYINGQEIRNWMQAPVIHDYLAHLGEDGWEMTGAASGKAMYGSTDTYQAFFKRADR